MFTKTRVLNNLDEHKFVLYSTMALGQGWWSRSKSEGANFDNEIYPMQLEAYNRYVVILGGLRTCLQENFHSLEAQKRILLSTVLNY